MAKNILTPRQIKALEFLGGKVIFTKQFYLTGGTALAGFYLRHRYSEDLDFFSETEVDAMAVRILLEELKAALGIKAIDFQQGLNRNLFFLDFGDETIKAEFTYFPFPRIEKGKPQYGIDIDSITDIAVNKLFSIYQRSAARDYIDLYLICLRHDFSIDRLIKLAKAKFDWHIEPIQLASQFLKSEQAADYPRMVIEINHGDWQKFFRAEAKKIKPEILE